MIRRISNLPQALSDGDDLGRRLCGASKRPSSSRSRSIRLLRFICDDLAGRELWPRKERTQVLLHPLLGHPVALLCAVLILEDAYRTEFTLPRVQSEIRHEPLHVADKGHEVLV